MGTSYETVANLLMKTKEFDEVRQMAVERLAGARLKRAFFCLNEDRSDPTKTPVITDHFEIEIGMAVCRIEATDQNVKMFCFNWYNIMPEKFFRKTVDVNFGTERCRTYNCKKDKVYEKFPDYARQALSAEMHASHKEPAEARIIKEMVAMRESGELAAERTAFRERQSIDAIKAAIRKFPVTKEILKVALDEYLVEHILLEV